MDRLARRAANGRGLRDDEAASALSGLDLGANRLDPQEDLLPEIGRDLLVAAVPVHEAFDDLLEAELAQARPAFVKVDPDLGQGQGPP